MDGAGYQFFTGAALAVNQDGAGGGSDGAQSLFQLLHGRARADDVVERVVGSGVAAQGKVLLAQRQFFENAIDGQFDFVDQAGTFANVIGRASGFHGFHRGFVVVDRRDQDDRGIGRNAVSMTQHFDAIDVWHLDVGDDQIVQSAIDLVFGCLAGLHGFDAMSVAAQGDVEHFADGALIVANQNVSHAASLLPQRLRVGRVRRIFRAKQCGGVADLRVSPSRAVLHRTGAT